MEKQTYIVRLPDVTYEQVREAVERIYGGGSLMWHNGTAYPTLDGSPARITRELSESRSE